MFKRTTKLALVINRQIGKNEDMFKKCVGDCIDVMYLSGKASKGMKGEKIYQDNYGETYGFRFPSKNENKINELLWEKYYMYVNQGIIVSWFYKRV